MIIIISFLGVDLPIKTQEYIHHFFEKNSGKNYMNFDKDIDIDKYVRQRIKEYHVLQNRIPTKFKILEKLVKLLEKLIISMQKIINIDRTQNCDKKFYKGANWISITNEMAKYIIENEEFIKRFFYKSLCADEMFVQTIAMNSPYKETIEDTSLRLVDWKRGRPYTWRKQDFEEIINSKKLWARKFSEKVDEEIIEQIYDYILSENAKSRGIYN